jgi:hypothetical protein
MELRGGSTMNLRPLDLRILAGLLAVGGTYWGVLLGPLIPHEEHPLRLLLVLGPGYLVTLAYYARAISRPPLLVCRCIWWLSLLVQGGWLAWHVIGILGDGGPLLRLIEPVAPVGWWLFATVSSVVALILEE